MITLPTKELVDSVEGFHLASYYAGISVAFAEVVAAGCKRLALSSPYGGDEAEMMREPTRVAAEEYGVRLMEETDLLKTRLFPSDVAEGKTVFLIARDDEVLAEYARLKEMRRRSDEEGNPEHLELDLAWRFGRLLSYSDEKIVELLSRRG
ncbi:MAG TPA: hypothetical protein VGB32_11775 [Candidatus Bathyarchaeia archaeon]